MNSRRVAFVVGVVIFTGLAGRAALVRADGDEKSVFADADARILTEIKDHSEVMENLEHLSDAIGPRLTGSPQLKLANDWTTEMFKKYGLSNVHLEPYTIAHSWTRGTAHARIVSPTEHPLTIASAGWAPGTQGTLRGPVVFVQAEKKEDFEKYRGKLKGAIVIAQQPAANTPVTQGSTVTLTVAKASTKVPVPDLSDMTLAQAQDALAAVGLGLGSKIDQPSDTVAQGHVISQDPLAGAKVKKGSLVDVTVSSGPQEFTLPDVTCQSFGAARSQLRALHLNVVNGGTAPPDPLCPEPNKVSVQDPSAGTKVHANDTVTLYTNGLTSPTPTP